MGIVERLRDQAHMTQAQGLAAMLETASTAADLIERLKVITSELADDLEAEVQQRWGYDIRLERQLARDMDVVLRARALIKEIEGE